MPKAKAGTFYRDDRDGTVLYFTVERQVDERFFKHLREVKAEGWVSSVNWVSERRNPKHDIERSCGIV